MSAVLSEKSALHSEMYEHSYYDWLMLQARLLREGKLSDADIAHIAEELEDTGNEIEAALVSYFRQAIVHLCKLGFVHAPDTVKHWRSEIANFRAEIDERVVNRFTNEDKITPIFNRAWKSARATLQATLTPEEFKRIPDECPFSMGQVRDPLFFPNQR